VNSRISVLNLAALALGVFDAVPTRAQASLRLISQYGQALNDLEHRLSLTERLDADAIHEPLHAPTALPAHPIPGRSTS
jgi:hypothetical protein